VSGLNAILAIGALVGFAGAVLALWPVREHEIERGQPEHVAAGEQEFAARSAAGARVADRPEGIAA
jgi:hypothetical protein